MTLLCELTDKYAKKPYLSSVGTFNEKYAPIIFGHHIYSFLYECFSKFDTQIDSVKIIGSYDDKTIEFFTSSLRNYSPDTIDYKSISEGEHWFPKAKEMENEDLQTKATDLIKNIIFDDKNTLTDDAFVVYIPLSHSKINELFLASSSLPFEVFTNGKVAKLGHEDLIKLDASSVKNVYSKIGKLKALYDEIFDNNIRGAKYYIPKKYNQNFNNDYLEELKVLKHDSDIKNIYFVGSDNFTLKEGINDLLGEHEYNEYSVYQSPSIMEFGEKSIVFQNFNEFFDYSKQNHLSSFIRKENHTEYLVLQGNNLQLITYFNEYKRILVPDENEIKNLISGIFISLLVHSRKYKSEVRTLYPLFSESILNDLLVEFTSAQELQNTIKDFNEIRKEDLLDNVSFWCVFQNKYKSKLVNAKKIRENLERQNLEQTIAFNPMSQYQFIRRKDNNFKIIFNGEVVTLPKNNLDGLLYIHGILRSNGKEVSVTELYALKSNVLGNTASEKYELAKSNLEDDEGSLHADSSSIQKYDQKYIAQMRTASKKETELIIKLDDELEGMIESLNNYEGVYDFDSVEEKEELQNNIKKHQREIERAKDKLISIEDEISKAINIHGQIRQNSSPKQNHYKAVSKSIKSALEIIGKYNPEFFNYLSEAVTYVDGNYTYRYTQTSNTNWLLDE